MVTRAYKRWTGAMEIEFADLIAKGMTTGAIAAEMDVTTEAVRQNGYRLGLMAPTKVLARDLRKAKAEALRSGGVAKIQWSDETDAVLRTMAWGRATLDEIAAALGTSTQAVATRMSRLKLRTTLNVPADKRARVETLAAEGWRPSRIAKQLGLEIERVQAVLAGKRTGQDETA